MPIRNMCALLEQTTGNYRGQNHVLLYIFNSYNICNNWGEGSKKLGGGGLDVFLGEDLQKSEGDFI